MVKHAPQFPIMGTSVTFISLPFVSKIFHESRGNQYKLLDWLNALVFPTESKFNDNNTEFIQKTYRSVVRRVLNFGVRYHL